MRDSRRRNRNIGTVKSGHGKDNKLTIPERWSDFSIYWEKLSSYVPIVKSIHSHSVTFLVEPPRSGYFHHCTVNDVQHVLKLLPIKFVSHIDLVVFRQPTAKQEILCPVWGRLGYWSEIGKYEGPGIYIEAQPASLKFKWDKSLRPDDELELERYHSAGFEIEEHVRGYNIKANSNSIRAKQLYYTIPHEIGHYVDYLESWNKFDCGDDNDRFWELYKAKPKREKEVFANRYADEFRKEMESKKLFPFVPKFNKEDVQADRLNPIWFSSS